MHTPPGETSKVGLAGGGEENTQDRPRDLPFLNSARCCVCDARTSERQKREKDREVIRSNLLLRVATLHANHGIGCDWQLGVSAGSDLQDLKGCKAGRLGSLALCALFSRRFRMVDAIRRRSEVTGKVSSSISMSSCPSCSPSTSITS